MGMWSDFKTFISRGNVVDLAVGIVIGAAFGKITTTLVEGLITPIIGILTSRLDFKSRFYDLSGRYNGVTDQAVIEEAIKSGAPLIRYGQLLSDVINFLIVAFVVFLIAKQTAKYFRFLEAAPAVPPKSELLLEEIRDILREQRSEKKDIGRGLT